MIRWFVSVQGTSLITQKKCEAKNINSCARLIFTTVCAAQRQFDAHALQIQTLYTRDVTKRLSTRIIMDAPANSADYYQLANVQTYDDTSYTVSLIPKVHYNLIRDCNMDNVTPRRCELQCRRGFIEKHCSNCLPGVCVCVRVHKNTNFSHTTVNPTNRAP